MSTLKSKNPMKMGMDTEPSIAPEFDDGQRITLLAQLQDLLHNPGITPVAWLCLWFADLDCLQSMCTTATLPGGQAQVLLALRSVDESFLQTWIDQVVPACPSDSIVFHRQPSHIQNIEGLNHRWETDAQGRYRRVELDDETDVCLTRDQRSCILTRATDCLEIAHIVPNRNLPSLGLDITHLTYNTTNINPTTHTADTDMSKFWETLSLFWSKHTVAAWARDLNTQNHGTNMLTMAPHVHPAWNKARFALQPFSRSPAGTLTAKFVWLKFRKANFPRRGRRVAILHRPVVGAAVVGAAVDGGKADVGPEGLKFWDCVSEKKVSDGRLVSFCVKRGWPGEGCPLPSWELLRMQWVLRRVVAFSGMVDKDKDGDEGENWWEEEQCMESWTGEGKTTKGDSFGGNDEGDCWEGPEDEREYGGGHPDWGRWEADDHKREHDGWVESDQFQGESDESGWYPGTPETPETVSEQVEQRCETISSISSKW